MVPFKAASNLAHIQAVFGNWFDKINPMTQKLRGRRQKQSAS